MRILSRVVNLFFLFALAAGSFSPAPAAPSPNWQSKVDAWVTENASAGQAEFLIFLTEQADLSGAARLKTKLEKGTYVYQRLTEVAQRTQGPLIAALKAQGSPYRPFWVANMVWTRGDLGLVQAMAMRSDVAHIYANPWVKLEVEPLITSQIQPPSAPETVVWNIAQVNADDVWAAGFTGQGAVIGGQDTGYAWQHPALIRQYRGWDGAAAIHDYNWHDAIHSGGGSCGANSSQPCDDYGHGTHTMGTMVGDDGAGHQVGMAPGARWIGCRNMNVGVGSPATYAECYQWFIAPTDLDDLNPLPEMAPDVINNSWGCPPSEGCTDPNVLLAVVNSVRAAGILTAHSAGNSGSGCNSVNQPPAIYDSSFSVGATDFTDTIASFSSRGPVAVDGSNRLKPDVSAPGVSVVSSLSGGGYGTMSGTSMAAPHVAGLAALLVSASPALRGQVDLLESLIESTALPRTTITQSCGGVSGTSIPNNTYGWGRIDALAAFHAARRRYDLWVGKTASAGYVAPGELLTYTLSVTNTNYVSPTHNLVLTDTLPLGTSFVSSNSSFIISGNRVTWQRAQLDPGAVWQVNMTVYVSDEADWSVVNNDYSASSDEVAQPVHGPPVTTPTRQVCYFPLLIFDQNPR